MRELIAKPQKILAKHLLITTKNLFTTSQPIGFEDYLEAMEGHVAQAMNKQLSKEITMEEVCYDLSQMSLLKSRGLDNFAICYYHKYWPTMGDEVCQAVFNCLNSRRFNSKYILHNFMLLCIDLKTVFKNNKTS